MSQYYAEENKILIKEGLSLGVASSQEEAERICQVLNGDLEGFVVCNKYDREAAETIYWLEEKKEEEVFEGKMVKLKVRFDTTYLTKNDIFKTIWIEKGTKLKRIGVKTDNGYLVDLTSYMEDRSDTETGHILLWRDECEEI